jgi:hypothetical protein
MKAKIKDVISVFKRCRRQAEHPNDRLLLDKQIKALKGIRDSLSDTGTMRYQLVSFEKLLCDPWINNRTIFDEIYTAWDNFRAAYASEIGGMTVNERLWVLGLMDDYEDSFGNPTQMRSVLLAAFLSEENIDALIHKNRA